MVGRGDSNLRSHAACGEPDDPGTYLLITIRRDDIHADHEPQSGKTIHLSRPVSEAAIETNHIVLDEAKELSLLIVISCVPWK
jgi:hypothetical protein